MRRDVVFDRGRGWRVEDDEVRSLRLGPDRGAAIGEYASREPGEYSDSYYGPGDAYSRRSAPSAGYSRERFQRRRDQNVSADVADAHRHGVSEREGYVGYGQMHAGARSWADLGVHTTRDRDDQPSFQGRGPKGYRRSDERLREIICERLTDDPWVDAQDIHVEVKSGEVTLQGSVPERAMKWRAEDLVDHCGSDLVIHNQLRTTRR